MELKVWVEGVPRVVCGLSQETSCQDVVIALAQAIGQTGRYVLIQKLRDKERQLVANERPLESLSKMGQLSSEVQFILRRTGPSSSDGPDQARIPPLIKAPNPEIQKHKEPKKSLTFNLGPSTSPRTPRAAHPSPPPEGQSKETLYQHILRQQGQLQALHTQMEVLEREIHVWERSPPPGLTPDQLQEMDYIEQTLRRNDSELAHEQFWEKECQSEMQREKDMLMQKSDLHVALDKHNQTLLDKDSRSEELEQEIQQLVESQREWLKQASERESAVAVKGNLDSQQQHGAQLEMLIEETEKMLRLTDDELQAKTKELDDLNKELRQCNLQQFIQQTGVTPLQSNQQTDEFDFSFLKPDGQSDEDSNYSVLEFNPRTTAKQILGNPRSLQNPLVSSLHPEVVSSTETSWR